MNINYTTKIEITVFHAGSKDTEGLDDVLMNTVRKWDYPITPAIYQGRPEELDEKLKEIMRSWLI